MADRPALFSGPLVRAILDGRKTQTRRLGDLWRKVEVGDRMWVRETWNTESFVYDDHKPLDIPPGALIVYRADRKQWHKETRWRPSIFMPRWASRITLDVVEVRREPLQDIDEADARAEGLEASKDAAGDVWTTARERFIDLWDEINDKPGKRWCCNPHVYVVTFKRATT